MPEQGVIIAVFYWKNGIILVGESQETSDHSVRNTKQNPNIQTYMEAHIIHNTF